MSLEIINYGAFPNDPTADPIFTTMGKIQDNFSTIGPPGSAAYTATGGLQQYSPAIRSAWRMNMQDVMPAGGDTGLVDCTASFQTALNYLAARGGGTLYNTPSNGAGLPTIYLLSSSLTIPSNCSIDLGVGIAGLSGNGVWGLNPNNAFGLGPGPGGTLLMGAGATIILSTNSSIQNGYVVPAALPVPLDWPSAITNIAAFAGTGLTPSGANINIHNMGIIGFATGIQWANAAARVIITNCFMDNTAEIAVAGSGDINILQNIRNNAGYVAGIDQNWPIVSGSRTPLQVVVRQGAFISNSNSTDVLSISNCFTYGHIQVGVFTNAYLTDWQGGGGECGYTAWGPSGLNLNPTTVVAITCTGTTSMRCNPNDLSGHAYGIINQATGAFTCEGTTIGSSGGQVLGITLGPNTASTFVGMKNNAGPNQNIFIQDGVYAADFKGNIHYAVNNPFNIADSALPYVTVLDSFSFINEAETSLGMITGIPLQYKPSYSLPGSGNLVVDIAFYNTVVLGDACLVTVTGKHATLPVPLVAATTYYLVPLGTSMTGSQGVTSGNLGLAASYANAIAATPVLIPLTSQRIGILAVADTTQNTASAFATVLLYNAVFNVLPFETSEGVALNLVNFGSPTLPFNNAYFNNFTANNDILANAYEVAVPATNPTAAGTNYNNATQLSQACNLVVGGVANGGVRLANIGPATGYFAEHRVINGNNFAIIVYPGPTNPSGGSFVGLAAGVGISVPAYGSLIAMQTNAAANPPIVYAAVHPA